MPFSDVTALIIRVGHELGQTTPCSIENEKITRATVRMRPSARHQGRARWSTDRLGYIGALKDERFGCKLVQVWGVDVAAVTSQDVGALLIRQVNQKIRFPRHAAVIRPTHPQTA